MKTGQPCSSLIVRYKNWRGRKFSRLKLLTENFIPQMAVFWNRAMWERAGGLDNDRHLDMDYDLWLRFAEVLRASCSQGRLGRFPDSRRCQGQSSDRRSACVQPLPRPKNTRKGWDGRARSLLGCIVCLVGGQDCYIFGSNRNKVGARDWHLANSPKRKTQNQN